jgi:hypothetical protein
MTGSDLMVVVPWLVFAAGLGIVCFLLVRSTGAARTRRPFRDRRPWPHHDPQETRCPENHETARPL